MEILGYPWWAWAGFLGLVVTILVFDLGVLHRKKKEIAFGEAIKMSLFYMTLALLFAGGLYYFEGKQASYEFATGYLIEQSLSLDNMFVFVLIFTHFGIPRQLQHRVLFWGILSAVILRGIMIAAGTALIAKFDWVIYLFGAFLLVTGIKMLIASGSEPDLENNRIVKFMQKRFRVTRELHGQRFFIRENGKLWMTPLFMVLVLVEFSDVIFAVDSIPAIFAVTRDPFIVFTSNVFAIMGLRSLYFALAAIIHRFHYLKYGLSMILVLIGIKMLVNHYYHQTIISTELSLGATLGILALSIIVSLVKTRKAPAEAATGWVPGSSSVPNSGDSH